jgi:hypothetical protein
MASASYIRKRREIARKRSLKGVEARRRKMMELAEEYRVVAEVRTSGSLGEHHIELLSCGDPLRVAVRFDGQLRKPRTAKGFVRMLGDWLWIGGKLAVARKNMGDE